MRLPSSRGGPGILPVDFYEKAFWALKPSHSFLPEEDLLVIIEKNISSSMGHSGFLWEEEDRVVSYEIFWSSNRHCLVF